MKRKQKKIRKETMIQDFKMEVIENGTKKSKIFNRYD
jgi:hypothetical protein